MDKDTQCKSHLTSETQHHKLEWYPDDDMDLNAAYRKKFEQGYNEALNDCIGLLRKWFWGTEKRARACEAEIRKLVKK